MTKGTARASECTMTQIVMPGHTNGSAGVLFGGVLMQWIDVCAGVAAMRHSGGPAVTASIDRLDFMVPVRLSDIVTLRARVNFTATTSMEVGCRVDTENPHTGAVRYTTKAYLTFVAVDKDGAPRPCPALVREGENDERRWQAAKTRRIERLRAAGKLR